MIEPVDSEPLTVSRMTKLETALRSFLGPGIVTRNLSRVLALAAKRGRISYDEAQRMTKESADDVLLLATGLRLLLPVRTFRSAAWEDRILLAEPGEMYEVPNAVRFLVENAGQTGQWNPGDALSEVFRLAGEPKWERIPMLVERIAEKSQDYRVNAVQIKEACSELGLGDRVDTLIAELKGSGVMSPKLSSFAQVAKTGAPLYELNPSLFTKKRIKEAKRSDWTGAKAY